MTDVVTNFIKEKTKFQVLKFIMMMIMMMMITLRIESLDYDKMCMANNKILEIRYVALYNTKSPLKGIFFAGM